MIMIIIIIIIGQARDECPDYHGVIARPMDLGIII